MDLSFRDLGGQGGTIVILHGLFGSSQNWAGMGRRLSTDGRVIALDLRNHGGSSHSPIHSLDACVEDLHDWSTARGAGGLRLIGHSMGGLVAMGFALRHADLTEGVAAIDIAPRPYPPGHERELRALRMDLGRCESRSELDELLAPVIPDLRMRQFLLTNAVKDGDGYRWRIDADVLEGSSVAADFADVTGTFDGEALMIACGRSGHVQPADHALMRRFFPAARIESLPQADHWPHVTAAAALETLLHSFLSRAAGKSGGG
jgi:pimeloyl-ACP methyl ester carboxylesterase